jgi:hypothetical protein
MPFPIPRFFPFYLGLLGIGLSLCGCGGSTSSQPANPPSPVTPPSIAGFSASPARINPGETTTLSWSVSGASSLSIDQKIGAVSGASKAVSPSVTTTYTLSAANAAGTATARATVTVNQLPSLTVVAAAATPVGGAVSFSVTASDPDGDALSLSAANLPAGASFSATTGKFVWTPTAAQTGQFGVVCSVSDGTASVSKTVLVTVTPAAASDFAVAYPSCPQLRVGAASSRQTPIVANATDGSATTFSLSQGALPPGMMLNADGSYSGTPTQGGVFDFTFQAANAGRVAFDAVHVCVVPADYEQPLSGDPGVGAFRPAANAPGYYVDAVNGLDSNDGLSAGRAWKTIAKLNAATLKAGDVVYLVRGSVWNETLRFDLAESGTASAPIVVEACGSGDAPTLSVAADKSAVYVRSSYITLLDLKLTGAKLGFQTSAESAFVLIAGTEIVDTGIGIYSEGSHHRFFSNYIHDLHMIRNTPGGGDDYGAEGVVMMGSNMEAAWNRLVNCIAPSFDFEVDGGAFETWGSGTLQHLYLHHNLADNVDGFMELTNNTDDLVIDHNLIINSRGGLCFHIDDVSGKNYTYSNIRFLNNLVYRNPKVLKAAVFTFLSSNLGQQLAGNDLVARNNIICCNRRLTYNAEALGARFVHDHNLYCFSNGGYMGGTVPDPTEKTAEPGFVDPARADYRLMPGSPAINAGGLADSQYDLDGVGIPQGGVPDIGCYEWQ